MGTSILNAAYDGPIATVNVGEVTYRVCVPDAEDDYIQSKLMTTHEPYEAGMLAVMAEVLKSGELVVDVGANIGNHTLYLACVVGCRVVSYEPNARLSEPLRHSVAINGLADRVVVRNVGVHDRAAFGVMANLNPQNLGAQSIDVDDDAGDFEVVSLDEETFSGRVAGLKIDVEGAELDVLRGAKGLIARDRPLLFVECGTEEEFDAVAAYLDEQGYVLTGTYNLTPTHAFVPVEDPDAHRVSRAFASLTAETYGLKASMRSFRSQLHSTQEELQTVAEARAAAESSLSRCSTEAERLRGEISALQQVLERQSLELRTREAEYRVRIAQVGNELRQLRGAAAAAAPTT